VTYRLVYTHRAARDIAALDPKTKERIGAQLVLYKEEPLRHAERLVHAPLGSFRFRIGDYRVVFDLEREEIVVLRVGHRREIYRR
jgi:mRNA interferase RelE/StbE